MVLLSIDSKNHNKKNHATDSTPMEILNNFLASPDKRVFILIYMNGCVPCEATKPEWKKLKTSLGKNVLDSEDVLVVDIDKDLMDNVKNVKKEITGFPTIRRISQHGNRSVDYDKDRSVEAFSKWIETAAKDLLTSKSSVTRGGSSRRRRRRTRRNKRKSCVKRRHGGAKRSRKTRKSAFHT